MRDSHCFGDLGECLWLGDFCVPKAPGLPSCHSSSQAWSSFPASKVEKAQQSAQEGCAASQKLPYSRQPWSHPRKLPPAAGNLDQVPSLWHQLWHPERRERQKRDILELVYVLCFPSWNPWSCLNPVVCARSKIRFLQTYLGQCVLLLSWRQNDPVSPHLWKQLPMGPGHGWAQRHRTFLLPLSPSWLPTQTGLFSSSLCLLCFLHLIHNRWIIRDIVGLYLPQEWSHLWG